MLGTVVSVLVSIGIVAYEARELLRQRLWAELIAVLVLVTLGLTLALAPVLGISIPSISDLTVNLSSTLLRLLGISLESQ